MDNYPEPSSDKINLPASNHLSANRAASSSSGRPKIDLEELKRREKELLERNEQINRGMGHQPASGVKASGVDNLNKELDHLEGLDVDFGDLDNDSLSGQDLKYDYSQVDPSNANNMALNQLKRSQQKMSGFEDQIADSQSLHLDPSLKAPQPSLEARGANILKKADKVQREETMRKAQALDELTQELYRKQETLQQRDLELAELRQHLEQALADLNQKDVLVKKLEDKAGRLGEESQRLSKELKAASDKNDQLKQANMDARRQLGGLERQKSTAEKEQNQLNKTNRRHQDEMAKKDQRINRLVEENEKLKADLKAQRQPQREEGGGKLNEKLLQENKRLEKQRGELLVGFKKQLKLIDVLKRQKSHLEAAQMLKFTEEEFLKALELGDALS